ncbi:hypothetical protein HDU67_001277 [Dinochytrium kinnereticum]|nr:hypothetical protein HDU67_001277 [Dinochytrium kinnereticum]
MSTTPASPDADSINGVPNQSAQGSAEMNPPHPSTDGSSKLDAAPSLFLTASSESFNSAAPSSPPLPSPPKDDFAEPTLLPLSVKAPSIRSQNDTLAPAAEASSTDSLPSRLSPVPPHIATSEQPSSSPETTASSPTLGGRFHSQVIAWKADVIRKASVNDSQSAGSPMHVSLSRRQLSMVESEKPTDDFTSPKSIEAHRLEASAPVTRKAGCWPFQRSVPVESDHEAALHSKKMKTRRGWFIAAIVVGILIIVCVPVGYIYWPRFPEIRVLNLTLADDGRPSYSFTLPPNAGDNLNYVTAKVRLVMQVSIYNPNPYDLELEKLDINANLNVNRSEVDRGRPPSSLDLAKFIGPPPNNTDPNYVPSYNPSIGTGSRGGGLIFPSRTNVTFAMNFDLLYEPDRRVGLLKDPGFSELLQVCGITRPIPRPARVSYDAVSYVKSLSPLGYYPRVANSVLIRCPASDEQLQALVDSTQTSGGNQTIIEILQQVFG